MQAVSLLNATSGTRPTLSFRSVRKDDNLKRNANVRVGFIAPSHAVTGFRLQNFSVNDYFDNLFWNNFVGGKSIQLSMLQRVG